MAINFALRDLYPSMGITETSTEVIPEEEDMEVLNENPEDAEKASKTTARGKNILFFLLEFKKSNLMRRAIIIINKNRTFS